MKGKRIWHRFLVWTIVMLMLCHGGGLSFAETEPVATSQEQTVPMPDPTAAPTAAPTHEPTAAPTAAPTHEPTAAPTAAPTPEPTAAPTAASTPEPTAAPTAAAAAAATAEPTATPAATATAAPSEGTTLEPEAAPTESTTEDPEPTTAETTEEPTSTSTTKPVNDPVTATPADSTVEPETTPAADPTGEPAASPIADPTDESEETPAADMTDEPEETRAADLTDEPEETPATDQTGEPGETAASEPTEDELGKEAVETEYMQTVRLDGILITVSAEKGVMGPEAELQISSSGNGDFTLAVEENLGTAEQEILYQRHQFYRISGTEPNGTLQIRLENMGLASLREDYPEGKVSVSVWRYAPEGKTASEQAKKLSASTRLQDNTVAFATDRTGLYDVVTIVTASSNLEADKAVVTTGESEEGSFEETDDPDKEDALNKTEDADGATPGVEADAPNGTEDPEGAAPQGEEETPDGMIDAEGASPAGEESQDGTEDAEEAAPAEEEEEEDPDETDNTEETDPAAEEEDLNESTDEEESAEPEIVYAEFVFEETVMLGGTGGDGDLFEQFIQKNLPRRSTGKRLMASAGVQTAGAMLSGATSKLYQQLANQIPQVATGSRASTIFTITGKDLGCEKYIGIGDLKLDTYDPNQYLDSNGEVVAEARNKLIKYHKLIVDDAVQALIKDYPYDLFWMDQSQYTVKYTIGAQKTNDVLTALSIQSCMVKLPVGSSYRTDASDAYTFNTTLPARVNTANDRIRKIIQDHKGLSTYQQLAGFKQAICNLVEYNLSPEETDSDSWQLINIFDGDPATTVNSDGYAKGFKYLCDLAGIPCITMTGTVTAPQEAAHSHTWNVVRLTVNSVDKYYPVDLANADFGRPGYPDKVFLHGSGYTYDPETKTKAFTFNVSGGTLSYAVITDDPDDAEGKAWIGWSATSYLYDLNSGNTIYEIEIISGEHGSVEASPSAAEEGDLVTLTVTPLEGYELDTMVAATEDGTTVTIAEGTGGIYTFTMPAGKVFVTASWKEETKVFAQINGVSGSFNDRIKLNFYFDIPQEILADQGAYVELTNTRKGSTVNRPIKDAEYVEGKGYKFSLAMVPVESGDVICAKFYDGNGVQITVKGASGTDYTASGVSQSLDEYMSWLAGNGNSGEPALARAAMDYCAAAKIYFGKNAQGAAVQTDLSGITADTLEAYRIVETGNKPEGITVTGATLMIESDNTLRLYLSFNGVNPDDFTYTIDGKATTLKKTEDGEGYLATKSGIYSNKLQVSHVYGIEKDGTFSLTASVLTYARSAIASEKENLQQLGRALYRYNQAAVACFGQ